jgi:hypothetical protein
LLLRKQWAIEDGPDCVLCSGWVLETRDHLFLQCSFGASCWAYIGIIWDCSQAISQCFNVARIASTSPCFMEIVSCAVKYLEWKEWPYFQSSETIFGAMENWISKWFITSSVQLNPWWCNICFLGSSVLSPRKLKNVFVLHCTILPSVDCL